MNKPTFDVVVFGATSFVGQILCRYLLKEYGDTGQGGARKLKWPTVRASFTSPAPVLMT